MTHIQFPQGFVWGAATSCYQIEGATAEDGRGESIWDRFTGASSGSHIKDGSDGKVACDHYHRWREDVALMKDLKLAAYRFSVAWPRVYPCGRPPLNSCGLDFYSRLVDALLEDGITPYLTLYHWDLPQSLQDAGGWANRATAEFFVEYADAVSRRLGDRVKHWITHNEPWCASFVGHAEGRHAPGLRDGHIAVVSSHHLLLSHGWAVPVIRRNSPGAEVGVALNLSPVVPASASAADSDAARYYDGHLNRWFLDALYRGAYPQDTVADYVRAGYLSDERMGCVQSGDMAAISVPTDFLGINYYCRVLRRSDHIPEKDNLPRSVFLPPVSQRTASGWEIYPQGIFEVLMRVHRQYGPAKIHVMENGASFGEGPDASGRVADSRRIEFLREHLLAAHRALARKVPLAGYFAWSLMDNFEWENGFTERFGLTWIDYTTQERILKNSALWYRRVIEDNGFGHSDVPVPVLRLLRSATLGDHVVADAKESLAPNGEALTFTWQFDSARLPSPQPEPWCIKVPTSLSGLHHVQVEVELAGPALCVPRNEAYQSMGAILIVTPQYKAAPSGRALPRASVEQILPVQPECWFHIPSEAMSECGTEYAVIVIGIAVKDSRPLDGTLLIDERQEPLSGYYCEVRVPWPMADIDLKFCIHCSQDRTLKLAWWIE